MVYGPRNMSNVSSTAFLSSMILFVRWGLSIGIVVFRIQKVVVRCHGLFNQRGLVKTAATYRTVQNIEQ